MKFQSSLVNSRRFGRILGRTFSVQFTRKAGLGGPTRWSEDEIQVALEGTSLSGVHMQLSV